MSKRERSPESNDPGSDRPSKRLAGRHILATTSSGNNNQQLEDWVQQARGLRIDGSGGGISQRMGVAGPGPSTSAQMDEDFAMAVEEDTVGVSPVQEERHENLPFAQQQSSNPPLFLSHRSQSLPNPSRHPYGHNWLQQRVRNAEGSPLINVVPATPTDSLQSLSMTEAPTRRADEHHPQIHLLQAQSVPRGTPPPSDLTSTSVSTSSSVLQDPAASMNAKTKRVAFGPRLDCAKCQKGEMHFTHVHYE